MGKERRKIERTGKERSKVRDKEVKKEIGIEKKENKKWKIRMENWELRKEKENERRKGKKLKRKRKQETERKKEKEWDWKKEREKRGRGETGKQ